MSTAEPGPAVGLATISRTVLSVAVDVLHSVERAVIGEAAMRTARGNAWEAVCADRARADRRAELNRLVADLAAARATATAVAAGTGATTGTGTITVAGSGTARARTVRGAGVRTARGGGSARAGSARTAGTVSSTVG
jgi:hypothetical protein